MRLSGENKSYFTTKSPGRFYIKYLKLQTKSLRLMRLSGENKSYFTSKSLSQSCKVH